MNKFRAILFCFIISFVSQFSFSQEQYSIETLLTGYLEHDIELKKLLLNSKKSKLELEQTKIEQGFDITLSTGTMTFYSGKENGSSINFKPSINAKIPSVKNMTASASVDYNVNKVDKTSSFEDGKISFGIDLISKEEALSKISIEKSKRAVIEAEWKLQHAALSVERKFYTELQSILNLTNNILTYRQDYYTDKLNFEKLKVQGYSSTSSTYRIAEMKVSTGLHNIEVALHNLKRDIIIFYNRCGISLEIDEQSDLMTLVPDQIIDVEPINFNDFDKENFSSLENARWVCDINQVQRKVEKFFTLGVNAGYTFKNSYTQSDTIDTSILATIGGVGLTAGVSLPVGVEDFSPAFTLSANVNPNSFKTREIKKQHDELSYKQDLYDIENAIQEYETTQVAFEQELINLKWEKETVKNNLDLYQKNETDLKKYYNYGIVSESEYLAAKNNRQLYEVKTKINQLEFILYNNDIRSKFVDLDDLNDIEK